MAGLEELKRSVGVDFDFSPGAQVPLSGAGHGQTAAGSALAATAYRDGEAKSIKDPNGKAAVTDPKISLLEPNLGEAFTRAVETRMLASDRKPLIQSFGVEPHTVVEHAIAAKRIRTQRDNRLTVIMLVCGVLFLPGVLVWLGLFQARRTLAGSKDKRAGAIGTAALVALAVLAVLLVVTLPVDGLLQLYVWLVLPAPIIGWLWAKRISEQAAQNLRAHWANLAGGGGAGAKIPEAVPQNPNDAEAERLRLGLAKIAAEQESNVAYYAGPEGILGMGVRWGSWQLAEDLVPAEAGKDIDPFRSWDVVRAMQDQLRMLERTPVHTGGFKAPPEIKHWVVRHVGEGAGAVSRPDGPNVEAYSINAIEVQRICNEQQFDSNDRHYLGVQFVLWDGGLVITMLISVTVLHRTLRIEVNGHALGPTHPWFYGKPAGKSRSYRNPVKPWKKISQSLPLVDAKEAVRLAARAPLARFNPKKLDELGGKMSLPEPFGVRHVWATKPWRHRFMADDALRVATPVLRVAHQAAIRVLAENNVDVSQFNARAQGLSGAVQAVEPRKADEYGM
ncbi:hypothetical protein [Streptomyces spiramenti]|uniref:Uncharacterized protein n=1 Tax=Streptomyces spiramenti TaxID=2720606 RepID=A0ABX1ACN1_9ACTN|nr:hypothetical protein [Streptomyces spiramenti]NJP64959.1 hypothetical protein [Streptomyces spiramenti]